MRIFALFNLKPGVSPQAHQEWAQQVDLPTANGLPSVDSFEVFRTTGQLGSDAPPPYAYIEVLDINDMDPFGREMIAQGRGGRIADTASPDEAAYITGASMTVSGGEAPR